MVCSVLANIYRDEKKRRQPYQPSDFLPDRKAKPKKPQTWQQMKAICKAAALAFGGKIVKKVKPDASNTSS